MRCVQCYSKGFGGGETSGRKHVTKEKQPSPRASDQKEINDMVINAADKLHEEILMRDVRARASSLNQSTFSSAFSHTAANLLLHASGKLQAREPFSLPTTSAAAMTSEQGSGGFSFPSNFVAGKRSARNPRPRTPVEPNSVIDDILGSLPPDPQAQETAKSGSLLPDDILSELLGQVEEEEEGEDPPSSEPDPPLANLTSHPDPDPEPIPSTDPVTYPIVAVSNDTPKGEIQLGSRRDDKLMEATSLVNTLLMKILASNSMSPEEKVEVAQDLTRISTLLLQQRG